MSVTVTRQRVVFPTYEPLPPDRNPMFFEHRVYQGSSGRVYPLPYYDRISEVRRDREWETITIENEYLQVIILPEIGGRIHRLLDKTNQYDAIYFQPVIKPALVGLAGPWASGGIEFNWPQHHRPSTFMPTDVHVEEEADGSVTVWLSEHDPMVRMKGMHGVCLRPGVARLELRVRVSNRTSDVQTFLWWANAATRVHERYQSFFPPDVHYVADHARRAVSTFPLCEGSYYGVDYAGRARDGIPPNERPPRYLPPAAGASEEAVPERYAANDLSWYSNIPVPTSYMALGSREDFLGGYDYAARAGLMHVADHRISPGKKQWTWGNHPFGYAWDRNLTDADANGEYAPYIELMAGVYTDNQPDFSFLHPGETRTWTQYWYPFREIGPARHANEEAALSWSRSGRDGRIGVAVVARHEKARVQVRTTSGRVLREWLGELSPARPLVQAFKLPGSVAEEQLEVVVLTADGRCLLTHALAPVEPAEAPATATEPPAPTDVASNDELVLIGLHLEQYRHATRSPRLYWDEALRRDPGDSRAHLMVGRWHLRRGEFEDAERHLRASIARLTARNANPADGEAYYQLGRVLRFLDRDEDAYEAFAKAAWNAAWISPCRYAMAEIDCGKERWERALENLNLAVAQNGDHHRARNLQVIVLRQLKRPEEASPLLRETLRRDPLDWWARQLDGAPVTTDAPVRLDLAWDLAQAGLYAQADDVLADAEPRALDGSAPLVGYLRAWLAERLGRKAEVRRHLKAAARAPREYCFPSRLDEYGLLRWVTEAAPTHGLAQQLLGFWLYDRRRHEEAIRHWGVATRLEPKNAVVWRCLGIAYFNVRGNAAAARRAYERAIAADPADGRLVYERDQLWKRLGMAPARRLRELSRHQALVRRRDDLAVEYCALLNHHGRAAEARQLLSSRRFQPWEGGEGGPLGQHVRAHVLLGRQALAAGDFPRARELFEQALAEPENLGEARHLLVNPSEVHYWLGEACAAAGDRAAARGHWTRAAQTRGDFQGMAVRAFSEMSYFSALSLERLGQRARARALLRDLLRYAQELRKRPAVIDYFATSLPTMLLFQDDLGARQFTQALFLEAQARLGLGQGAAARRLLRQVQQRDPSHAMSRDLLENATQPKGRGRQRGRATA